MAKIIFPDIDGPPVPFRACFLPGNIGAAFGWQFDPCAVHMLNFLAWAAPDLRGVIASHRVGDVSPPQNMSHLSLWQREFWEAILQENGLKIKLHEDWITVREKRRRPKIMEITDWLKKHPKIKTFVTIDDEANDGKLITKKERDILHLTCEDFYDGMTFDDLSRMWDYLDLDPEEMFDKYRVFTKQRTMRSNANISSSSPTINLSISVG